MNKPINLYYQTDANLALAHKLGKQLINVNYQLADVSTIIDDNYLFIDMSGDLIFYSRQFTPFNLRCFYLDFYRKKQTLLKNNLLLKAANLRDPLTHILDLTAGLGRDSLVFAFSGHNVTMIENNPYLVIILEYLCHIFAEILPKLQVVYQDSLAYLRASHETYSIVYLDPMFDDNKPALAKKDMQIIDLLIDKYALVVDKPDYQEFIHLAANLCPNKMIIKRDNKQAPLITKPNITYSVRGKTVRFDVYQLLRKGIL